MGYDVPKSADSKGKKSFEYVGLLPKTTPNVYEHTEKLDAGPRDPHRGHPVGGTGNGTVRVAPAPANGIPNDCNEEDQYIAMGSQTST